MTKLLFTTTLLCFLMSCEKTPDCSDSGSTTASASSSDATAAADCTPPDDSADEDTPTDETGSGDTGIVPPEALGFEANIAFTNFDSDDEAKVEKAIEIIKKVVASQEFKDQVINFTYSGEKKFVDNKGLTNEQIYQQLLDGREDLLPVIDHEMDLELELYYSWTSTVGYTYPDGLRIWMNTKFFNSYTPAEVAGNIFHEWTHKLGFDHAHSYSVSRDSSVPYALGYLMEDLGKQYE